MLKIKKRSAIALIASAVVSQSVFADKQFNDDVSYALGYFMGKYLTVMGEEHKMLPVTIMRKLSLALKML